MKIILYEDKYRDDMIFMILQAKDALNKVPNINEDLLDIKSNYLQKGDMFWLAIDENQRVVGTRSSPFIWESLNIILNLIRFMQNMDIKNIRQGI